VACSTTGCDGFLQAFSEQSGIELGHGILTGIAGGLLALTGIPVHHRGGGGRRFRTAALLLSLFVLATIAAFVIGVYALNDGRLHLWGIPAPGTYLTAAGGLLGFGTGWRIRPMVQEAD